MLFVGITRAQDRLVLTHTQRREMHGRTLSTITSDFLQELMVDRHDCAVEFQYEDAESDDLLTDEPDDRKSGEGFGDDVNSTQPGFGDGSGRRPAKKKAVKRKLERMPHLTTGAALEAGSNQSAAVPIGFGMGMQVRHPRYGLGTVVAVSGLSRMRTVTVEFMTDNRRESFIAAKCPLQPVGFN